MRKLARFVPAVFVAAVLLVSQHADAANRVALGHFDGIGGVHEQLAGFRRGGGRIGGRFGARRGVGRVGGRFANRGIGRFGNRGIGRFGGGRFGGGFGDRGFGGGDFRDGFGGFFGGDDD